MLAHRTLVVTLPFRRPLVSSHRWLATGSAGPQHRWKSKKVAPRPDMKRKPYSKSEETKLMRLKKKGHDFHFIAAELGRTYLGVSSRYYKMLKLRHDIPLKQQQPRYTAAEDNFLVSLRAAKMSWEDIAKSLPQRPLPSLKRRYHRIPYLRLPNAQGTARKWSPSEKQTLVELRRERRLPWPEITHHLPGRTIGALANKYNALSPMLLRKPAFTAQEDNTLLALREESASWATVQSQLPSRTLYSLKSRYYKELWPKEKHSTV